ncbi:MAG TPA: hypothetical protein PKD75_01725, partial [Tepidiformaceae bacterium]|nr:hypothetical protein [Tepidiformaceae bacterium]
MDVEFRQACGRQPELTIDQSNFHGSPVANGEFLRHPGGDPHSEAVAPFLDFRFHVRLGICNEDIAVTMERATGGGPAIQCRPSNWSYSAWVPIQY